MRRPSETGYPRRIPAPGPACRAPPVARDRRRADRPVECWGIQRRAGSACASDGSAPKLAARRRPLVPAGLGPSATSLLLATLGEDRRSHGSAQRQRDTGPTSGDHAQRARPPERTCGSCRARRAYRAYDRAMSPSDHEKGCARAGTLWGTSVTRRTGRILTLGLLMSVLLLPAMALAGPAPASSRAIAACIRDSRCHRIFTVAHRARGFGGPDNSRAAVAQAVAAGVPVVEIDLRGSKDGELFVMHDGKLESTTTLQGRIERLPSDVVASALLRNGEGVPRFRDVYQVTRGRSVLSVDFKVHPDAVGERGGLDPRSRLLRRSHLLCEVHRGADGRREDQEALSADDRDGAPPGYAGHRRDGADVSSAGCRRSSTRTGLALTRSRGCMPKT